MDRRQFLNLVAAGAAVGPSIFLTTPIQSKVKIGSSNLYTVSDGYLVLPQSFIFGDLPKEEAAPLIEAAGYKISGLQSPCNISVWETESERILFDSGAGLDFMSSTGKILEALGSLDLAPEDITHVVFTHGHPDHLWGVIDDFDEPLFYNAKHFMGVRERDYWMNPDTMDSIGEARQSFAAGALRRLEILGSDLDLFDDGNEIVPGLKAVSTPGHTPGHMAFRISQENSSALIVGDAIANGHLALSRPDWPSPADQESKLGISTRMSLLEELSHSDETVVGFHFKDGGMGKISKSGEEFKFTPHQN